MKNKIVNFINKNKYQVLWFFFSIVHFSIVLRSGYWGDDIYNSTLNGYLQENSMSFLKYVFETQKGWLLQGRVFPFSGLLQFIFHVSTNLIVYKSYLVLFTIVDIFVWGIVINKLTNSKTNDLFFKFIMTIILPLYNNGAPNSIYMFNGIVQSVVLFGGLAIIMFFKSYKSKNNIYIFLELLFLSISFGTYEIGFTFSFVLILISILYSKNIRSFFKTSIPILATTLFWSFLNIFAKLNAGFNKTYYEGLNFSINSNIFNAFKIQFLGALPLYTYFTAPQNISNVKSPLEYFQEINITLILEFGFVIIFLIYFISKKIKQIEIDRKMRNGILLIGFTIWSIPALILSLSVKYQTQLTQYLTPYIPQFLQIFGLGLILTILFIVFMKNTNKLYKIILFSLTMSASFFILVINYGAANEEITWSTPLYNIMRQDIVDSIEIGGVFNDINNESLILIDNRFCPTIHDSIFSTYSKNVMDTEYYTNYLDKILIDIEDGTYIGTISVMPETNYKLVEINNLDVWVLKSLTFHSDSGKIITGRLKYLIYNDSTNTIVDTIMDKLIIITRTNEDNLINEFASFHVLNEEGIEDIKIFEIAKPSLGNKLRNFKYGNAFEMEIDNVNIYWDSIYY